MRFNRYRLSEVVYVIIFYILVFQSALMTHVSRVFSYFDEMFVLVGIFFVGYSVIRTKRLRTRKTTMKIVSAVSVFVACGMCANLLFQYQPLGVVLEDLQANLKFFLSVISGVYLYRYIKPRDEMVLKHTRGCTVFLFCLLLLDAVTNVFPTSEYRYGIRISPLVYPHVTYLAGTCIFLLAIFLFFYEKKNIKYMVMALLLLMSTLRSKAVGATAVYILILYLMIIKKERMKLWHMIVVGFLCIVVAWDQISFYYIELSGKSARSVLTMTSLEIMKDYFPIGTGFGTYASNVAGEHYSPVYVKYGFRNVYELRKNNGFFSDTFWPIIIGQTGFIGTISYLSALSHLCKDTFRVKHVSRAAYASAVFIFAYLLISATSEPAFSNSISIPLAMLLGWCIEITNRSQQVQKLNILQNTDGIEHIVGH